MRITRLPLAAGLLLAGLALSTETAQAQTTKPSAHPKSTPKTTPKSTAKPTASPKPTATVTVNPQAQPTGGGALVNKRKGQTVQLPDNDATAMARQRVTEARAHDVAAVSEQDSKALAQTGESVVYDEHNSLPKNSVMQNLAAWRDHLLFQMALRANGLDKQLEKEEVTVFAPTDAALLPVSPKLQTPKDALQRYIIPGTHKLTNLPDNKPLELTALDGSVLNVVRKDGGVWITSSKGGHKVRVVTADIPSANGVLMVIDGAL